MNTTCGYVCPQCEGKGFLADFSDCDWCKVSKNMIQVYHNNRCSKSRDALQILTENNHPFEIKDYIKEPPTALELGAVINKLKITPFELIRKNENVYKENFKDKHFSDSEWIDILVKNPILIERPIVINGQKAVIARPPEKVLDIL
jgi:arsenate reductase